MFCVPREKNYPPNFRQTFAKILFPYQWTGTDDFVGFSGNTEGYLSG